jgi:hypothetical protein
MGNKTSNACPLSPVSVGDKIDSAVADISGEIQNLVEQSNLPKLNECLDKICDLYQAKIIGLEAKIAGDDWVAVDSYKDLPLGTWLVKMPVGDEHKLQIAYVHQNITFIGHCFAFDERRVTAYKSI